MSKKKREHILFDKMHTLRPVISFKQINAPIPLIQKKQLQHQGKMLIQKYKLNI